MKKFPMLIQTLLAAVVFFFLGLKFEAVQTYFAKSTNAKIKMTSFFTLSATAPQSITSGAPLPITVALDNNGNQTQSCVLRAKSCYSWRNWVGVNPVCRRKYLAKWLGCVNPHSNAISVMVNSGCFNNRLARSIRCWIRYWCAVIPVDRLNNRQK